MLVQPAIYTDVLIHSTTQAYLEKWLRLMLLWNPKQRGGGLTTERRPRCFDMLDTLLAMKVWRNV